MEERQQILVSHGFELQSYSISKDLISCVRKTASSVLVLVPKAIRDAWKEIAAGSAIGDTHGTIIR